MDRVYVDLPGEAGTSPYGASWTTVDPRQVANYADAAGFPEKYLEAIRSGTVKVETHILVNNVGVKAKLATNIGGRRGGLFELEIPNAMGQTRAVANDEVFNPF